VLEREIGADTPINDIDYDRLKQFVDDMRASGSAPATISRKLSTLSTALKWAYVRWTDKNGRPALRNRPVFPNIKVRNYRDRYLSKEEEQKAFAAIAGFHAESTGLDWWILESLIMFLIDTGARLGEALSITKVNLQHPGYVTFNRYETKTDKPRSVPLTGRVRKRLSMLVEATPTGPLFSITPANAWRKWRQVRDVVPEIDDVNLHILRHTCASRLLQGGVTLHKVAEWLGHTDLNITKNRYGHLSRESLDDGLVALEEGAPEFNQIHRNENKGD